MNYTEITSVGWKPWSYSRASRVWFELIRTTQGAVSPIYTNNLASQTVYVIPGNLCIDLFPRFCFLRFHDLDHGIPTTSYDFYDKLNTKMGRVAGGFLWNSKVEY